jgi:hypothetical protein
MNRPLQPISTLIMLPGRFAIARMDPTSPIPPWVWGGDFTSVSRSPSELSLVCAESVVPAEHEADRGWRAFVVAGPMDLSIVGVLASITQPLAAARVALFAVSTFETDYILVREDQAEKAMIALRDFGHEVVLSEPQSSDH